LGRPSRPISGGGIRFGGKKADDVKRLKELERANARGSGSWLTKELEVDALREIARGNWLASRSCLS
jgi:hypothetical protein